MHVNTIQFYMQEPDARSGLPPRSQWRDCCAVVKDPSKEVILSNEEKRRLASAGEFYAQQQEMFRGFEALLTQHLERVHSEVKGIRACVEDRIPISSFLVTPSVDPPPIRKLPSEEVPFQPVAKVGSMPSMGEATRSIKSGDKDERKKVHDELMEVVGWNKETHVSERCSVNTRVEEPPGGLQGVLWRIMSSNISQGLSSVLVFANVVMIAVVLDVDVQRASRNEGPLSWEAPLDLFFNIAFMVELVLRVMAFRKEFFTGASRGWNLLDFFIVSTGLIELVQLLDFSLTYLRILRVVRVVRVMRILRLFRFFRDLRMMALSIFSCLVSLFWAFILLMMTMVVFSIMLLEGERDYYRRSAVEETVRDGFEEFFPNLLMTVYHLLAAVTGGKDWTMLAQPFVDIHWFYGCLFTVFIMFVMFGLLNVLIGVFVQSTGAIADIDRDFVIQEEMARNDSVMNQMRELFQHVDEDNSGTITWAELKENLANEQVKAYFSLLSLDVHEAQGLFHLLDMDESGEVGIEEFIMGCMRLKGTAKSIDLATLLYENKRLHKMMTRTSKKIESDLADIRQAVTAPPA